MTPGQLLEINFPLNKWPDKGMTYLLFLFLPHCTVAIRYKWHYYYLTSWCGNVPSQGDQVRMIHREPVRSMTRTAPLQTLHQPVFMQEIITSRPLICSQKVSICIYLPFLFFQLQSLVENNVQFQPKTQKEHLLFCYSSRKRHFGTCKTNWLGS